MKGVRYIVRHPIEVEQNRKKHEKHVSALNNVYNRQSREQELMLKEAQKKAYKQHLQNKSKESKRSNENAQIQKQNNKLLNKLLEINMRDRKNQQNQKEKLLSTQNSLKNYPPNKSLNYLTRVREAQRIASANVKMVENIMSSKSSLNSTQFKQHIDQHEQGLQRITKIDQKFKKNFALQVTPNYQKKVLSQQNSRNNSLMNTPRNNSHGKSQTIKYKPLESHGSKFQKSNSLYQKSSTSKPRSISNAHQYQSKNTNINQSSRTQKSNVKLPKLNAVKKYVNPTAKQPLFNNKLNYNNNRSQSVTIKNKLNNNKQNQVNQDKVLFLVQNSKIKK